MAAQFIRTSKRLQREDRVQKKTSEGTLLQAAILKFFVSTGVGSDMWSNIILGVSRMVFLCEINIYIGRLRRADYLPRVGKPHTVT